MATFMAGQKALLVDPVSKKQTEVEVRLVVPGSIKAYVYSYEHHCAMHVKLVDLTSVDELEEAVQKEQEKPEKTVIEIERKHAQSLKLVHWPEARRAYFHNPNGITMFELDDLKQIYAAMGAVIAEMEAK